MDSYGLEINIPEFFRGKNRYEHDDSDIDVNHWSNLFKIYKFVFDRIVSILVLPFIAVIGLVLLVLNPFLNPGPLFFVQTRMGKHRRPFRMIKFRTMLPADQEARAPNAGLELDRITPLGHFLRNTRIDELPNFINVLRGEMSVIGPRPDAYAHAEHFSSLIGHYNERFRVKPGITGLAQVELGYADGDDATATKALYDQMYVETSCGRLDVFITFRTVYVMATGFGAR